MAKDILRYREHHVRDWETSETVRLMSYAARGIYQALLDAQWEKGSIPCDEDQCVRLLRCDPDEWMQFLPFFDECFPVMEYGMRRANERLAKDREDAWARVEQNREAGKRSGEARRLKSNQTKEEQPLNDRSSFVHTKEEQPLNPTTTATTFPVTNVTAQNADVVTLEMAREASEPFGSVARVLIGAGDGVSVPASKVRRYTGRGSPVRGLITQYGESEAARLVKWAATHKRLGVQSVFDNSEALVQEARGCKWGAPGGKVAPRSRMNEIANALGVGDE